jgi:hypothetical protein
MTLIKTYKHTAMNKVILIDFDAKPKDQKIGKIKLPHIPRIGECFEVLVKNGKKKFINQAEVIDVKYALKNNKYSIIIYLANWEL